MYNILYIYQIILIKYVARWYFGEYCKWCQ